MVNGPPRLPIVKQFCTDNYCNQTNFQGQNDCNKILAAGGIIRTTPKYGSDVTEHHRYRIMSPSPQVLNSNYRSAMSVSPRKTNQSIIIRGEHCGTYLHIAQLQHIQGGSKIVNHYQIFYKSCKTMLKPDIKIRVLSIYIRCQTSTILLANILCQT